MGMRRGRRETEGEVTEGRGGSLEKISLEKIFAPLSHEFLRCADEGGEG